VGPVEALEQTRQLVLLNAAALSLFGGTATRSLYGGDS